MDFSIKQLCQKFKISRSTLLYYDQIGLFKASHRSSANYRKYSEEDLKRLEQIFLYRQMGVPLQEIKKIIDGPESTAKLVLEQRLRELNEEDRKIRTQQRLIIDILENEHLVKRLNVIDRDTLVDILDSAGFDEMGMCRIHAELEQLSPAGHQNFLESLGINDEEITKIRQYAMELNERRTQSGGES